MPARNSGRIAHGGATQPGTAAGSSAHKDFISFRDRLKRLVDSLVALRHLDEPGSMWPEKPERVEVTLESESVQVEFTVAGLSWTTGSHLVELFQGKFGGSAPLLVESAVEGYLRIAKAQEKDGSYGRLYTKDRTTLAFRQSIGRGRHEIKIETGVAEFNDHFETFVTEAARVLFPPVEKPRRQPGMDAKAWQKEFGRSFERLGCQVLRESLTTWRDVVGLEPVRQRLERAVLLPLMREGLYQKVARAVMPSAINLMPRGVLLVGPPGTGKTWSMRALAGEAGLPVVSLPCDALMTKWYGESEQRLAGIFRLCREAGRMILFIDELDALARHRQDSHETTARLVSILLAEMDGLAGSSEVVTVGSANAIESIDTAVLDRFDLTIPFDLPNADQRRCALAYYARHLAPEDVADLANRTDGWNFRRLARFAEAVVRTYVAGLDVSQLEASTPPLPQMDDYLKELEETRRN